MGMSRERLAVLALIALCAALLAAGCTTSTGTGSATPTATKAVATPASTIIPGETTMTTTIPASKQAVLKTSMGEITIALYDDMPVTSGNFEKLVSQGFYNNVTFHRVIDRFMIQGGDPTGTGTGDPGYKIKDEFPTARKNRNDRGTIAMANAGPNTGGSQFFINLVDNNYLDTKHPAFGRVVKGMEVVDAIGKVPVDAQDRPVTPVVIVSAEMT
jgi:peptidylprolyl isomerase